MHIQYFQPDSQSCLSQTHIQLNYFVINNLPLLQNIKYVWTGDITIHEGHLQLDEVLI